LIKYKIYLETAKDTFENNNNKKDNPYKKLKSELENSLNNRNLKE